MGRTPLGVRLTLAVALVIFALLALPLSAADASPPTAPRAGPPSTGLLPASYSAPFAERAGFNSSVLAQMTDAYPATGLLDVVVTFVPSNPGLFAVPPSGAAPLTVAEIGQRYGLSPEAYASAEAYFESYGLTVMHAGADRLSLTVGGPAASVAAAFGTELLAANDSGRAVTYPSLAPTLPFPLESQVAGVTGLSSGFDRFSLPLTPLTPAAKPTPGQGSSDLVTPAIARQIYSVSSLYNLTGSSHYASSEGIVVLLWGDGYAPSDISTFYTNDYPSGFPAVTVVPYPIDGAPAPAASAVGDPSGAPEELTLDIEWAGSTAPGATVDAVYAPDGPAGDGYSPTDASMADALNKAVTGIGGVDVISMSFGTAESTASGLQAAWATDLAEATTEQITLLAATGDNGGDTSVSPSCSGTPQPDYPSSDADVLAVGGTDPSLARNPVLGTVTGIASESAWADSGGGFGSDAAPEWQTTTVPQIASAGVRGMPDVAAAAATDYVYYNSADQQGGGTSFASPFWGGLVAEMDALHGSSLGLISPRLYSIGAAEPNGTTPDGLVDITSGSNCLGPAGVGWDTATGWGSPRGLLLYEDLTSTFVHLSIAVNPSPVGPGSSLTITASLANDTSGAPIAGVPVLVTLTADTTIGPCGGTFATADPTTNATGGVSVSLPVPGCYLGTHAVASVQVTSDGYFGSDQATVGVNLLGYLGFLGPAAQYPGSIGLFALFMGIAIAVGYLLGRGPPPGRHVRRSAVPPPTGAGAPVAPPAAPPTAPAAAATPAGTSSSRPAEATSGDVASAAPVGPAPSAPPPSVGGPTPAAEDSSAETS